ncbi:excalibur calcium-binding protein [Streptomyces sp. NPDC048182]|uniref:excalibur calcium-binding protein n=1 Tax=Streptomyces sp. NPDC048182 TaxID=3365507 RepID=UPI003719CFCF
MRRRTGAATLAIATAAIVPLADPAHAQDQNCRNYAYQEDAQAALDRDRNDPGRLDREQGPSDGRACEALPRRASLPTISATWLPRPETLAPAQRATPTTAPTLGVQGGLGGSSTTGPTGWDVAIGLSCVSAAGLATALVLRRRRRT